MAIDFPNSPSTGQLHTVSGKQWQWDSEKWIAYGATISADILYIDTGNNRVGINDTSPSYSLDVNGTARITGNLTVQGTTTTIDSATIAITDSFVFEGAVANDFETTLTVAEPTADRTITLPDATGTVATQGYVTTALGALSSDSITDADANTKIQVEESADENIIRFDTAGTERMTISAAGVVATAGALTAGGVFTASGGIADGATAATQSQSDGSTKLATTAYVDTGLGTLSSISISDADSDTKIQVEESADEDIIRFDTAGTERMTINADGTISVTQGMADSNIVLAGQVFR